MTHRPHPSFLVGCFALVLTLSGVVRPANGQPANSESDLGAKQDAIVVRAIERMENFDYRNNEKVVAALTRHIRRNAGTPQFLQLAKKFKPPGMESDLVHLLLKSDSNSDAVDALGMLLGSDPGRKEINRLLKSDPPADAVRTATMLGLLGNRRAVGLLSKLVTQVESDYGLRAAAVRGLAKNNLGQDKLLELAEARQLASDLRLLAGGLLAQSANESARNRASKLLPLPAQADQKPVPPLDQLVKLSGDPERGLALFRSAATCSNCHLVSGFGKQVGPDLSEIGTKLSREAMLTSILDPSAGISHNYENYVALLDSGQVISGIKVSETEQKITLRTAEAIDRELEKDEIEELVKSEKSIMPENLHHTVDQQGLVDIVEYMMTLKKKSS